MYGVPVAGVNQHMSKKVAVVEDEAELASLIEYNLSRGGFQVNLLNGAGPTMQDN